MKYICHCGVCGNPLVESDKLADHKKFDFDGSLDYIELAHEACGVADNQQRRYTYWETGPRITEAA